HAHGVLMLLHGGHGPIKRRQRVVAEQEAETRIVPGAALLVERTEAVEPERGTDPRPDADLEREDLRRKLAALVHVAEARPEVADGVRDGLRVIGIRAAARQGLLEAATRGLLPLAQPLPEQAIELPDDAVPDGSEIVEQEPAIVFRERPEGGES